MMPWSHVVHHNIVATSCDHACAIRGDCMQLWHSHLQDADDDYAVFSNQVLTVLMNVECANVKGLAGMHTGLSGMSTHCCNDHRHLGTCRIMCVFQHRAGW